MAVDEVASRARAFEAVGVLQVVTDFERALASPTGETRTAAPARLAPARIVRRRTPGP